MLLSTQTVYPYYLILRVYCCQLSFGPLPELREIGLRIGRRDYLFRLIAEVEVVFLVPHLALQGECGLIETGFQVFDHEGDVV